MAAALTQETLKEELLRLLYNGINEDKIDNLKIQGRPFDNMGGEGYPIHAEERTEVYSISFTLKNQ